MTGFFIRYRNSFLALLIAVMVLGLYGMTRLPVDFLPAITYPMIKVHIWWRGATPDEVVTKLAEPIERQMATVDDLDYLESSSIEGMYTLLVNFKYGVDVNIAYQDALSAMARVARQLPKEIEPPIVIKADPSQLPVGQITVSSDQWDLVKIRTWVENDFQDMMSVVPGVAGTEIVGGLRREIRVHLDPDVLEKHGLTLAEVTRRLRDENVDAFGGRVYAGKREIIARTAGEFQRIADIRDVVLRSEGARRLTVGDVARVEDSHEETRIITRIDGRPCVKVSVLKQATANTVEVAAALRRYLAEIAPRLPPQVRLGIVENQADYIEAALAGVRDTVVQTAVVVLILFFLFFGNLRHVGIMLGTLVVTVVVNFGLMNVAGFSLNIFSLGGLIIAIGVMLDNATVVIENITRLRGEAGRQDVAAPEVVAAATSQVGGAMTAGTVTFLIIFVPFLLVPGLVSLLFRELIFVIAGIVFLSLVFSLSLVPVETLWFLPANGEAPRETAFQRFFRQVEEAYRRLLERVMTHRATVAGVFVAILLAGVLCSSRIGSEFLPTVDDGRIMIKVKGASGLSVQTTDRILQEIEAKLKGDPVIESAFTLVGGKVWGLYTYEIANEGEIDLQLVPKSKRKESTLKVVDRLRPIVGKVFVPGGKAMVMPMPIKGIRKLGDGDIELKIRGPDLNRLNELARQLMAYLGSEPGFTNQYLSLDLTKPEYRVEVDRVRAAQLGMTVADVAQGLRSLVSGSLAGMYREGQDYYPIRVMIPEREMTSVEVVEHLPVENARGEQVRLHDLARVVEAVGPVEIAREDQTQQIIVRTDVQGISVGEGLKKIQRRVAGLDLPVGYAVDYGGRARQMLDMQQTVLAVLGFALLFAFLGLVFQFDQWSFAIQILAAIPFCLAGVILALFGTGMAFGATMIIGILIVVSAAVNDGVLLVTFAAELEETERLRPAEAVVKAAAIRLRPRVLTTLSTLVGLLPLALNLGEGTDLLAPMAVGAIGGLLMEIPVALFLMPVFYVWSRRFTATAADGPA